MMNDIFRIEIDKGFVHIYLDDILIFSPNLESHHRQVRKILQKCRDNKLYLKPEKCSFDTLEVEYLGVIISQDNVTMDLVKVEAIATWPEPQSKQDIQSFLGFCNFYHRFIKGYAAIAYPLHSLTGNSPFKWSDNHDSSFTTLRNAIMTSPILMIPTDDDPFRLETDASEYAVGAVLSQKVNSVWRPVAFLSKALSQTQRNYAIYDCELLAIMIALQEFRKYLISAKHPFEILTDHANLQYFKQPQKLNHHQARWLTKLQEFHFTLHHVSGVSNSCADILSRKPGFDQGVNDNDNTILLPPKLFVNLLSPHHLPKSIDIQEISMDETPSHDLTTIEFMPRILRVHHEIGLKMVRPYNHRAAMAFLTLHIIMMTA